VLVSYRAAEVDCSYSMWHPDYAALHSHTELFPSDQTRYSNSNSYTKNSYKEVIQMLQQLRPILRQNPWRDALLQAQRNSAHASCSNDRHLYRVQCVIWPTHWLYYRKVANSVIWLQIMISLKQHWLLDNHGRTADELPCYYKHRVAVT
jgi:hypothetical protein